MHGKIQYNGKDLKYKLVQRGEQLFSALFNLYPIRLFLKTADKFPVLLLWLLVSTVVLGILAALLIKVKYPAALLLMDDGYYNIARGIYEGSISIWHQRRYPGQPLLFTVIHFFPEYLHLLIRIYLTLLALAGSIYFSRRILGNKVTNRNFFIIGLLVFCNPLMIHWSIKSAPEPFLTFFLGAIILASIQQTKSPSLLNHIILTVTILAAIAFKPVFFLIPVFLSVYYLFKRIKPLYLANITIACMVIASFVMLKSGTRPQVAAAEYDSYGTNDLLATSYIVKSILETGQYYYGSDNPAVENVMPETSVSYQVSKGYNEYREEFFSNYPNASENEYVYAYIRDNFGYWVLSKLLNPIMFFTFTFTPKQAMLGAVITTIILVFSFVQLKKFLFNQRGETEVFLVILLAFSSVYFMTFSFARYSFPVIFYLSMYAWTIIPFPRPESEQPRLINQSD